MAQIIKLKRTLTPDNPPAALAEGELAAGLGDYPVRMWIGMPDGSVQELFAGTAVEDAESDWVYGRSNGKWIKVVVADDEPPAAPKEGVLWWDTAGAQLYGWTGEQWVVAVNMRGAAGPRGPRGEKGEEGQKGDQGVPGMFEGRAIESQLYRHNSSTLRMTPGFVQINGEMIRTPPNGDIAARTTNALVDDQPGQSLLPSTTYLVFAKNDGGIVASFRSGVSHRQSQIQGNEGVEVLAPFVSDADPFWRAVVLLTDGLVDLMQRATFMPYGQGNVVNGVNAPSSIAAPNQPADGLLTNVINFTTVPGNYGYMRLSHPSDFAFGINDFCIELYIRPDGTRAGSYQMIFGDSGNGSYFFYIYPNGTLVIQFAGWGASWQGAGTPFGTVTNNEWQHVAVYRNGTNFYGAHNGVVTRVLDSTPWGAAPVTVGAPTALIIGNYTDGYTYPFIGQMASIRVTKGHSRYGANNFTPPPPPFLQGTRNIGGEDPTESLIGIVRTDAARQFIDEPRRRLVRSWRKDPGVVMLGRFSSTKQSYWGVWHEMDQEIRTEWVQFENEIVELNFQSMVAGGAAFYPRFGFGIDSIALPFDGSATARYHDGTWRSQHLHGLAREREGHHFATVLINPGGTWLYLGSIYPADWPETMPALKGYIAPRS